MALLDRWGLIRVLVTALLATAEFSAAQSSLDEYTVKAAFLFNFAKFVDWPPESFKGTSDPIRICTYGPNPFGGTLEQMVQGKVAGSRAFTVSQIAEASEARECHILFLGTAEKRIKAVLGDLSGMSVLTVGETASFLTSGGMIRFKIDDEKVRIEIDAGTAARAKLRISSKLLKLADAARRQP